MTTKYKFTKEQQEAIGQLMVDRWGCNFQTSFPGTRPGELMYPRLWSQRGPGHPTLIHDITPDGTVIAG